MIEVQELFRWHRDLPKMPSNLTTIQQQEWENERATLFDKYNESIIGQKLSMCPAIIDDIGHDKIAAHAQYDLDYRVHDPSGKHGNYTKHIHQQTYARISYEISYEKSIFYDQIKSIFANEMVELQGILKKVSDDGYGCRIQLSLSSIAKTETRFLHAELLDENLRYQFSFTHTYCFIATACYGNYDAPEVLVLRQFRDDKLLKTLFGKVFVRVYYSVSPFFAKLISKSDLLKTSVRQYVLEPLVTKFQRQNKH